MSRTLKVPSTAPEIIILSSDDDEPAPRVTVTNGIRAAPIPADVVQQLNSLKMECAAAKELNKKLLDTLDEQLVCDMCYDKMFRPYTLQCGHTFCCECLQTWFTSDLAKYMAQNPDYNPQPNMPRNFRQDLQRRDLAADERAQILREIQHHLDAVGHPDYTCPSCRMSVTTKPIEAFTVKNIVDAFAQVEAAEARGKGKHVASARRGGPSRSREKNPFGGFFLSVADYVQGF